MSAAATGIILIAICMVIITDLSGIVPYIKQRIWKHYTGSKNYPDTWDTPLIHLFGCSLCQTWWLGLIYLIIVHSFTLPNIALLLIVSYLTTSIKGALELIKDIIDTIIYKIRERYVQ